MKTYIIKRTLTQMFEVEANNKQEALRNLEDPYSVKVVKEVVMAVRNDDARATGQ